MLPLIYAGIAAGLIGLGSAVGWKVTSDYYEAKHAKDDRVALEDFKTAVLGMNQLSAALEESRREKKIVYKTIRKLVPEIVERPVYRNECVDDDGLRVINYALAGQIHTGESANPVPADPAVGGENRSGHSK